MLEYFDPATGERYVPYVIEPAAGVARTMMAFLIAAYTVDEVAGEERTVLRLHPRIAPYQVAVLPLSKKDTLLPLSQEVLKLLQPVAMCDYDITRAIGRRYRRQDEIGTPLCVTIDFDSLEDKAVTIRDRDSTTQERVPIDRLVETVDIAPRLVRPATAPAGNSLSLFLWASWPRTWSGSERLLTWSSWSPSTSLCAGWAGAGPGCARSTRKRPVRSLSTASSGLYYCFGCQARGDAISFLRETEHLDFVTAVEALAGRAGIQLRYDREDRASRPGRQAGSASWERPSSGPSSGTTNCCCGRPTARRPGRT